MFHDDEFFIINFNTTILPKDDKILLVQYLTKGYNVLIMFKFLDFVYLYYIFIVLYLKYADMICLTGK